MRYQSLNHRGEGGNQSVCTALLMSIANFNGKIQTSSGIMESNAIKT